MNGADHTGSPSQVGEAGLHILLCRLWPVSLRWQFVSLAVLLRQVGVCFGIADESFARAVEFQPFAHSHRDAGQVA